MASTRRWTRAAAALGAIALVAAACGGGDATGDDDGASDGAAAPADDGGDDGDGADGDADGAPEGGGDVQESITIGINNPNYATQLAVILALESGYFEAEGITDVEIIETDDYIAGLIGGSLDVTQGDTDIAFGSAEASGEDIRFLGTYRDSEYQILAVREGIESADDLVGAQLTGGALGSRNQLLLERIVTEEFGLEESDVQFVPQGGNSDATLQAIISGTVDGGSLFPRHRFALEEAGGQFLYEELFENPQEGVLVMGSFLEENRATVDAYLRATLQARQDVYAAVGDADAEAAIFETMRGAGFEIPEEFEGVFELEVDQISADMGFEPELMDALVAQQVELGNLPDDIDWRQYVDLEPLHAAQEALGLELRPASLD